MQNQKFIYIKRILSKPLICIKKRYRSFYIMNWALNPPIQCSLSCINKIDYRGLNLDTETISKTLPWTREFELYHNILKVQKISVGMFLWKVTFYMHCLYSNDFTELWPLRKYNSLQMASIKKKIYKTCYIFWKCTCPHKCHLLLSRVMAM